MAAGKKTKNMGTNKVSQKDIKKARPKPNVKQDVPRASLKAAASERDDFTQFGPKRRKELEATAGRIQADKAMQRISPKRPRTFGTDTKDKVGYKSGR